MSWILVIFAAWVSDSEPPNTVKSLANTNTVRPLTVPQPVTTPSPGTFVFSMPKSSQRCWTNMSNSSKEPAVEQQLDPLACRELAARVLRRDALFAAAEPRFLTPLIEPFEDVLHRSPFPVRRRAETLHCTLISMQPGLRTLRRKVEVVRGRPQPPGVQATLIVTATLLRVAFE